MTAMIDPKICRKLLTVGPIKSKGGISSVMCSYSRILKPFDYVSTYVDSSKPAKLWASGLACLQVVFYCLVKRKKIVHLHSAAYSSFQRKRFLAALARTFGAKTIFHIHNGEFDIFAKKYGPEKIKRILSKNAAVIALSDFWKKNMESVIGLNNIVVINNIVNTPAYGLKPEFGKKINILFLGIICPDKGIYDLIDTIAKGKEYYRERISLTIGGKGEVERLKALIKDNRLGDFIKFAGWVGGDEKEQLIRDSDIYVLPSYHEGMPISILEAMAYGKPIVATGVGGIPEIVHDGENGILVTPGDNAALDRALRDMIDDRDRLKSMGKRSIELVRPYLDASVAGQLEALYIKCMEKK